MAESTMTFGYWNIRAGVRGHVNRYIMAIAGVEYNDKRYDPADRAEWTADKESLGLDFPNLPYIIDGDFKLTESKAVSVYLCDKYAPQLLGDTAERRASVKMLHDIIYDHMMSYVMQAFKSDDRQAMVDVALAGVPKLAGFLGSKNFLLGDEVTMADLMLFEDIETVVAAMQSENLYTDYPALKAYQDRVRALPGLAEFLASPKHIGVPFFIPQIKVPM